MDKSNHSVQSIQSNGSVKSVIDIAEKAARLKRRKKLELKLIRKYDRSKLQVRKECWFIMDCKWLNAWSEFVLTSTTKESTENDHTDEEISIDETGPDPPGPISTKDLLGPDGKTPLPDLKSKIDYRGVLPVVYFIFLELYGKDSSPEICRYLVDIYKAPVPDEKLVHIKLTAMPRAAVEVNKIRPKWMKWEIDQPEDDEEDVMADLCCCCPCLRFIRKEHIEAFIYWAIICWASCCRGGRRRHGRGDISYSKYTPLRTPQDDMSEAAGSETSSCHGTEDGKSTDGGRYTRGRQRAMSVSSQMSRNSRMSNGSKKSNAGSEGGGVEMNKGKQKKKEEESSDEDSEDEFHAGPADKNDDQRIWVRSLLWQ
mmetsp:Transcript_8705/g.12969  ORF Transcript_8705/g.12969 Transcript_8705/m.12969 type:complete len:369 (+) Transcript_8705:45-1151(+)